MDRRGLPAERGIERQLDWFPISVVASSQAARDQIERRADAAATGDGPAVRPLLDADLFVANRRRAKEHEVSRRRRPERLCLRHGRFDDEAERGKSAYEGGPA